MVVFVSAVFATIPLLPEVCLSGSVEILTSLPLLALTFSVEAVLLEMVVVVFVTSTGVCTIVLCVVAAMLDETKPE